MKLNNNIHESDNTVMQIGACAECPAITANNEKTDDIMTDAAEEILKESAEKETSETPFLICFVCTGNTCRSPMAAAWFNHIEAEKFKSNDKSKKQDCSKIKKRKAISAGISPIPGTPISENAKAALCDAGVESNKENPWKEHRAQKINTDIMKKCDLVIGISGSHTLALITEFPEFSEKICSMPNDISDPYGGDINEYKECLDKIKDGISEFFS